MSLTHPDKIFSKPLPPPPLFPKQAPLSTAKRPVRYTFFSALQWKKYNMEPRKLENVLRRLQKFLRAAHRRKIIWSAEESISSSQSPIDYLTALLSPIIDIFSQLRSPGVLDEPMKLLHIGLGQGVYGWTFQAEDFQRFKITAPIILYLPNDLFNGDDNIASHVEDALLEALEHSPSVPSIIVTDLQRITVFLPPEPARKRLDYVFEDVATTQLPMALRVISTAYLLNELPQQAFSSFPYPFKDLYNSVIPTLPEGPPQNPSKPLLGDEEVFSTYQRLSDFDLATVVRDRPKALQFFRWYEHVQKQCSKLVAHPGDTIPALANQYKQIASNIQPAFPFHVSDLPSDTVAHLREIQRKSPLASVGLAGPMEQCQQFSLQIQDIIAEGSRYGICTVYRCKIASINNQPIVSSPPLCLKLFDDRFRKLLTPTETYFQQAPPDHVPLSRNVLLIAEDMILNEVSVYDKLRPVQGSVVPWFYGMHQFTLPGGLVLYGLLMEYIEGWALDSTFAHELGPDRQIKIIHSARQVARVLDIADIGQRDWHKGQILLCNHSLTKRDHVVLIDFASTDQTRVLQELNYTENYIGLLRVLVGLYGRLGIDADLVWKHFGEPDDWDPVDVSFMGETHKMVAAKDMFTYISPL